MNENIDLTKILEGCEGMELYSPIFGNCFLREIIDEDYPIRVVRKNDDTIETFTKEGFVYKLFPDTECLIFPSKEQRDWSKFVRPIKEGTPMMCSDDKVMWTLMFYKEYKNHKHYVSRMYTMNVLRYKYMVRFKDFNPNDIEGSLEYNIQNNGD